jgi:hypothetical protein
LLKKRSRRNWPRAAAAGLKAEAYKSIWGVEKDFVPARKAHLAFIVDDLAGMATKVKTGRLQGPGGRPIEGCDRRRIDDSFGNQIELIEPHAK